jgi:hypothetical protein
MTNQANRGLQKELVFDYKVDSTQAEIYLLVPTGALYRHVHTWSRSPLAQLSHASLARMYSTAAIALPLAFISMVLSFLRTWSQCWIYADEFSSVLSMPVLAQR